MIHKLVVILFVLLISICSIGYSESGSTLFENGIAEFQKGRYQDAVFWFTKLIEKEPFNAKAYKNRGVARLSLQKYDMAIEDLNNALNPDPEMEDITGNLGPAWHYKQEYQKAMDDFKSALNLDPDLEGIHSNIGVAWYYAREYQKAVEEYTKEIKKFPENYSAYFNRALSLVELKEYEKALDDLNSVLTIKPDEYWAIVYQGDIYFELNNLSAARESYLAAMPLNTDNNYAKDKLQAIDAEISASRGATQASTEVDIVSEEPETISIPSTLQAEDATRKSKDDKLKVTQFSGSVTNVEKQVSIMEGQTAIMGQTEEKSDPPTAVTSKTPEELTMPSETHPVPIDKKVSVSPQYTIQLGAFLDSNNAANLIKTVQNKGYKTIVLNIVDGKKRQWTLVRTGEFQTKKEAGVFLDEIKKDLKRDAAIRPVGKF